MNFCHDLTLAQHHLLSKAFVLNVPGSVGVPFNPSVLSVCPYSSIFKSRNSLNIWVFLVLQALHTGLENYLSPDNHFVLPGVSLGFSAEMGAEKCGFSTAPS